MLAHSIYLVVVCIVFLIRTSGISAEQLLNGTEAKLKKDPATGYNILLGDLSNKLSALNVKPLLDGDSALVMMRIVLVECAVVATTFGVPLSLLVLVHIQNVIKCKTT